MLSSFRKGKVKKLLILAALLSVVGVLHLHQKLKSNRNVKKEVSHVDNLGTQSMKISLVEIPDHVLPNTAPRVTAGPELMPSAMQHDLAPAAQQGNVSAPQQGIAPATHQGDAPATQKDLAPAVQPNTTVSKKKYLIYLCDKKIYCFGLGDRQRGLVGVYFLAELTNRTFGLIMTAPTNLTEFYQPNLVNWDIPAEELKGKSTKEIDALGARVNLNLKQIVFDQVYPQDVVYVRTNQVFQNAVRGNAYYQNKKPKWAQIAHWRIFAVGWLRLMRPTDTLRLALNEMLVTIAQAIHDDYQVWQTLKSSGCCSDTTTPGPASVSNICENAWCTARMNKQCCAPSAAGNRPAVCKSWTCSSTSTSTNTSTSFTNATCIQQANTSLPVCQKCTDYLQKTVNNATEFSRLKPFSDNFCNVPYPRLKPNTTVEKIRQLKGHDTVNVNLVCVHVRIGRSSTLPFEGHIRNKESTVKAVWDFLKPFIAKGYHAYIATDSEKVRADGKRVFGDRLHVSNEDIVHIASVKKGQDQRSGFKLTLMEQLLLMTSCKVLVASRSGYSMRAATVRYELGWTRDSYMFENGGIYYKNVHWM